MENVFILRVEEYNAPESKILVEEAYNSRTNAVKSMKKYWDEEKKKWLKEFTWRNEDDFTFELSSKGGRISYGWASKTIYFTLTRLKINDNKN